MSNAVLRTRQTSVRKHRHVVSTNGTSAPRKTDRLHPAITNQSAPEPPVRELEHPAWYRSDAYEFVNALTHGAGLALSIVGALVMGGMVLSTGDPWRIAGCGVFVGAMMAVYTASTLSHSGFAARWRSFFRRLDQGTIYLLVVGTYTPFGLAFLRNGAGWFLLVVLWIGAIVGFASKVLFAHRLDSGLIWTYVTLGVLPTITIPWLWNTIPAGTGPWMFLGGAFYLAGTYFLINDHRVKPFHAIWHLLVIAGTACHFLGILSAVASAAN